MPANVDTSFHPHTSGAAAEYAAAHASEHPLKLYGGWFCPFVQRSWITLHEKHVPHQYIEINPYHKDPQFLELNPRGLIPTLAVPVPEQSKSTTTADGTPTHPEDEPTSTKPLGESLVICDFLDEAFSDTSQNGPSLLPPTSDPYGRAVCRLWIDHVATRIVPAFYRLLQHTDEKAYSLDEARAELVKGIRTFAEEMLRQDELRAVSSGGGPWFLGAQFSLVDITLAPWACRLFLVDHYKPGGTGIPDPSELEDEKEKKVWGRWTSWFQALQRRQSVVDTLSEKEQYVDVYKRYAEDTTNSEVGQATRKGRGLP